MFTATEERNNQKQLWVANIGGYMVYGSILESDLYPPPPPRNATFRPSARISGLSNPIKRKTGMKTKLCWHSVYTYV